MIIDSPRRREHLAAIAERMPAHVERLSWSADQIEAERMRALREMLAFAKAEFALAREQAEPHRPGRRSRRRTFKPCR